MVYLSTGVAVTAMAFLAHVALFGISSAEVIREGMMSKEDFPLRVRCDPVVPFTYFQEGVATTMAQACGSAGDVNTLSVAMTTVTQGDWIVTFVVQEDVSGVEQTYEFSTQQFSIVAGMSDITEHVSNVSITVPTNGQPCGDRMAGISLRITPAAGVGDSFMTSPKTLLVTCDFTGVDFSVGHDRGMDELFHLEVTEGDTTPPAGLQELIDTTYTASTPSTLPTLANDAPYFIAAFLQRETARGDVTYENDQCGSWTEDSRRLVTGPELELGDKLVGYMAFKDASELSVFDEQMTEWLRSNVVRAGELCGRYMFVVLIDPMYTIPDENRCDNFMSIRVSFVCSPESMGSSAGPTCSVTLNPFRAGKDSPFLYDDNVDSPAARDRRIFKYDDDSWREESPREEHWDLQLEGYARVALLARYARDSIDVDTDTCMSSSEPIDVADIEGTEVDAAIPGSHIAMYSDFADLQQALADIRSLKSDLAAASIVLASTIAKLGEGPGSLSPPTSIATWTDVIAHNLATGAYNVSMTTAAMLAGGESADVIRDHLKTALKEKMCMLAHEISTITHYLWEIRNSGDEWRVIETKSRINIFINTSGEVKAIKEYLGIPGGCFDVLLLRSLDMIIGSSNVTENIDDRFLRGCRDREHPCLRRARRACSHRHPAECRPPTHDDRQLVCEMKAYIRLMRNIIRPVGLHDIRRRIDDEEDDDHHDDHHDDDHHDDHHDDDRCRDERSGDQMRIEKDLVQLWKYDNGVFKRGELSYEKHVCWKDMAVCRCDACASDWNDRESGSGGGNWSGDNSGSWSGSGDASGSWSGSGDASGSWSGDNNGSGSGTWSGSASVPGTT